MKASFENTYEHIGYLLYALAAEFRKLSSSEDNKLNELIDQYWQSANTREAWLEVRLTRHLHSGIENAFATALEPTKAFNVFENYYLLHKISFGESLRERIRKCCNAVAHEFYRLNHDSELIRQAQQLLELKPDR